MNKKYSLLLLPILAFTINFSNQTLVAQTATAEDENAGAEMWLNAVWENVDTLAAEEQVYNVEKVTTVAGVRGAEAKSDILDHLYYRKKFSASVSKDIDLAVSKLELMLKDNPTSDQIPLWQHFLIQGYNQQGAVKSAELLTLNLKKNYPNSKWAKLYVEDKSGK